jgi:prolyl-tRNA synthetase
MKWSHYFIPTLKETPLNTEAVSHQMLLRAGLVHMLTSGVYSYLPLGLRVLKNVERIICEEMNAAGANQLFLPALHPLELWKQTGRDQVLKDVMYKFKDGRGREMCLGPTHEEVITDLVKSFVQSYRQLPTVLYQIQTKFRDELRPRYGIVRASEFIMKDAYSFDRDKAGLDKNYKLMFEAYNKIFKRWGLNVVVLEADTGAMGGDLSHEYLVPASIGEDMLLHCEACGHYCKEDEALKEGSDCPKCNKSKLKTQVAIELGHIFQLGTKYSVAQQALFLDEEGKQNPIIMGCYGIGVSRVIAAIIEKNNDPKGIIWPKEVAPFQIEIVSLHSSKEDETYKLAFQYHDDLSQQGIDVLWDDRDETPGRKFNDADLIGIPLRVTVGKKSLTEGKVELKSRLSGEVTMVEKNGLVDKVKELL